MSAVRQQLLRQLEARIRQGRAKTEICWQLTRVGVNQGDVWAFERGIRRQIRNERSQRRVT